MRRSILALVVFILVAGSVMAGVWTLIVPKYEAKGEIRIRPIIPRLVFQTEENGVIPFYDAFVNTHIALLRSQTVLQRVLDQPEVHQTQWYKSPRKTLVQRWRGDKVSPLDNLRHGLSVQARPQAEIIDVSFTAVSDNEARIIVDVVLQQYIRYVGESASATDDRLYRELTAQYSSLEAEIKSRERTCFELCRQLGTDTPRELLSGRRVRLDETQARLQELRNRISSLEWAMKQADATSDGNSPVNQLPRQPPYHEDEEWRTLHLEARRAQHQIDKSVLTPNSPDRAGLTKDLEFARELQREREQQLDEQWRDHRNDRAGREEGLVPVEHQRAKYEEQILQAGLERQQEDFDRLFDIAQAWVREDRELQHRRALHEAVRRRLDQKNIERNAPSTIEVAPAECPSRPNQDPRLPFTAGAILLGFCVSGGTAVLTRGPKSIPAQTGRST